MSIGLEEYVFLVRNLRGVYAPLASDDHEHYAGWLIKRYKYRDIGVPRCVVEASPRLIGERLGGKPFHLLEAPTRVLEQGLELARGVLGGIIDECLASALLLSLVYASPLYLTSSSLAELRRAGLVVYEVRGGIPDLGSARLHMRIAGYTVLDYYVESVKQAVRAVEEGRADSLLEERREFAERDSKRYWRIIGRGDDTVIAYLDHVHVLAEKGVATRLVEPEARILLAMPAGFVLDPAIRATS